MLTLARHVTDWLAVVLVLHAPMGSAVGDGMENGVAISKQPHRRAARAVGVLGKALWPFLSLSRASSGSLDSCFVSA